jgi:hypothetical protein
MNIYTIYVPKDRDAENWFKFINENLQYNGNHEVLLVDFNKVNFLETDDFVVLACLIEFFYTKGFKISFTGGTKQLNNHLDNIKFKHYWREGFDRSKFTSSSNESTLCLWKISKDRIYAYSVFAKKYFEKFAHSKDLLPLASNLDEVFNNIFDHSQSQITGYIITQYYHKINKISFSVCDFGIGIPQSIRNYDKTIPLNIEDYQLLLKSLQKGYSIKSTPQNRGFGLHNIQSFIENTNGMLSIVSNNGVIKILGEKESFGNINFNFKGTLIKVEVDLNYFNDIDDSESIMEF